MASSKQRRQQLTTLLVILVLTEIILHFCWKAIDEYFFTNFQATAEIALISAIALLAVLVWREELVLYGFRGDSMSRFGKAKDSYGGVVRKGKFDAGEYVGYLVYIIFALTAFGLMASDVTAEYTWLNNFCAIGVAGSALFVFLKGKEKKENRKWTALEAITLGIAIIIPVALVWQPLGDLIHISAYLDAVANKLLAFLCCLGCLWIAAKQD